MSEQWALEEVGAMMSEAYLQEGSLPLEGSAATRVLTAETIGLPPGEGARVSITLLAGASAGASELVGAWLSQELAAKRARPETA